MKKIYLICFCIIILIALTFSYTFFNKSKQVSQGIKPIYANKVKNIQASENNGWKVEIVDITNGKEIEAGRFIITDIDKEFAITKENNTISIPQKKETSKKNEFPYAYTTITTAKGYYPRIDVNLMGGGGGGGTLKIPLNPIELNSNQTFTQVFHYSSASELVYFFNHYNIHCDGK